MGETTFDVLRSALLAAGFSSFTGEPDLFCWHPQTGKWFFAEAKGRDKLTESQRKWFQICRSALGDSTDIRVYRLRPDEHKTSNQTLEDIGAEASRILNLIVRLQRNCCHGTPSVC